MKRLTEYKQSIQKATQKLIQKYQLTSFDEKNLNSELASNTVGF
jgi:hypothetical protein